MKLVVLSDTHGCSDMVTQVLLAEEMKGPVHGLLYAGDGLRDVFPHQTRYPHVHLVRGNCDGSQGTVPDEDTFTLNGTTLYLSHGHRWHVKYSLNRLAYRAREVGAQVAIYGHTHSPQISQASGVLLLNPGTLTFRQYAILTLSQDGLPEARLKQI